MMQNRSVQTYFSQSSISFVIVDADLKVAAGSFLNFFGPAGLVHIRFLIAHNRQGFATYLSIEWNVLFDWFKMRQLIYSSTVNVLKNNYSRLSIALQLKLRDVCDAGKDGGILICEGCGCYGWIHTGS